MAQGDIIQLNEALIQDVGTWTRGKYAKMKLNIALLSSKGKGDLLKNLRYSRRIRNGEIEGTGFKFLRHGVFFQKGVGKGQRQGQTGKRKPKDWFNKEIENIDDLANMVTKYRADIAVKGFTIK